MPLDVHSWTDATLSGCLSFIQDVFLMRGVGNLLSPTLDKDGGL